MLPRLTPVTAVNRRLEGAAIVREFVETKRHVVAKQMSVEERRVGHPLKKDNLWKLLEPRPIEYKSLRRPAEANTKTKSKRVGQL